MTTHADDRKRRRRAIEAGQRDVLERIARGERLASVLEAIVLLIESAASDAIGSILLLDRDGKTVRHGAATRLPEVFVRAIDGAPIGPTEGSCGAAAFTKARVIVEDIATHPNWAKYREIALPVGLRACWSTPILSSKGDVLGTFAMYYDAPRAPTADDLAGIDVATHLASIAIESRRREEDLEASERRYRLIYETVNDVVFHLTVEPDEKYRFEAINPAFTKATGLTSEQVVGKRVDEVLPAASYAIVSKGYREAIATRSTVAWEEVTPFPTGTKYGDVQVTPVFDADDRCTALVGTVHDVTPHKEAADRIREQAALLEKAHDAIIVLGLDETVRYWNMGATKLYGVPVGDALGKPLEDLVRTEGHVRDVLRERLLLDQEFAVELRRTTRDGSRRIVESSATLVRDDLGEPTSILLIDTDITERKAIEAQFHRAQRIESLGTLAGGVAHDFNNILTGILGHVRAATKSIASDSRARLSLGEIEKASWRAADLTKRILTFSRRDDAARAPIDLRGPVEEAVALLRATIPPPIVVRSFIDDDVSLVIGDATSIHQVVMNLGTNAAHALGARPGNVDIALSEVVLPEARTFTSGALPPGRFVRLSVSDEGEGIDARTLERIFEPYFSTKASQGTGLGLSVVHGIVSSHDGAIDVSSEPGRGTTFSVYLPAVPGRAVRIDPSAESDAEARGHGERVLFVDDEAPVVELAKTELPDLGYVIDAYTEPTLAIDAFEKAPASYDVLVTDSAMYGMTGYDLIRRVRKLRADIPILVISGRVRPADRHLLDELGVDEVVPKPLVFPRIAGALRRVLARARNRT